MTNRVLWRSVVSLSVVLTCLSCTEPDRTPAATLDGYWLTDGYGSYVEIENSVARAYEVTAISCIAGDEAPLSGPDAEGRWRLMQDEEVAATLVLESPSVLHLQPTGTVSYRTLRRVDRRSACAETTPDTPVANYDVFWTTFSEHYPFFAMKGIDWQAVRETSRARVADDTSPEQLYELLMEMITPLEDAHTSLVAEALDRQFIGVRHDPEFPGVTSAVDGRGLIEARFERALEIIESEYLVSEMQSFCKGHLRFGELGDGLFYVRLDQEGDYTDEPGFQAQVDTFEEALDQLFTATQNARGLVLDVRKNYGGSDILSLALASRLAHEPYFAYAKVARLDPADPSRRTPPQERLVQTTDRPSFAGPVVQLIGPYTISAGETLTQALLGRQPRITRVGENTQGVFSDVLGRRLPNGWRFGLANELFLTRDGQYFDGPGIPPDIEVPVFRQPDLDDGRDPALEKAIELLSAA